MANADETKVAMNIFGKWVAEEGEEEEEVGGGGGGGRRDGGMGGYREPLLVCFLAMNCCLGEGFQV